MVIRKIIKGGSVQDLGKWIREFENILVLNAVDEGVYHSEDVGECANYPWVNISTAWVPPGHTIIYEDPFVAKFGGNGREGMGEIWARTAPNETISLTISWDNDHPHLEGIWQLFESEYIRQGWVEVVEGDFSESSEGKGGRPHLPDDVWAWEQVNKHKYPKKKVRKEWNEKPGVKIRNLQDPERQFNRITKLDWYTGAEKDNT